MPCRFPKSPVPFGCVGVPIVLEVNKLHGFDPQNTILISPESPVGYTSTPEVLVCREHNYRTTVAWGYWSGRVIWHV